MNFFGFNKKESFTSSKWLNLFVHLYICLGDRRNWVKQK